MKPPRRRKRLPCRLRSPKKLLSKSVLLQSPKTLFQKYWKPTRVDLIRSTESSPAPPFISIRASPRIGTPDSWFLKYGAGPIWPSLYVVNPSPESEPERLTPDRITPVTVVPALRTQSSCNTFSQESGSNDRSIGICLRERDATAETQSECICQPNSIEFAPGFPPQFLPLTPETPTTPASCGRATQGMDISVEEDVSLLSRVVLMGLVAQYSRNRLHDSLLW